ncbi:hypothetical protein B1813_19095 [Saccharomonospora piscinae]|uniref:Zinc-finger domain-containing protein n=1 Tax=Saccharomonospora piscinae TaxID=687388 RepID=A0A1V8ZYS3_SACPI|nr:zinc finger protein [Saccharomonospora piscinae]OQO89948.1 hypothetical protein B1813_19095 [Saccharomonospora piscinae]
MQRYLWQQADGARHAYDTEQGEPELGRPLATLCGATVVPRTQDYVPGMWLDPTCEACEDALVVVAGWSAEEMAVLRGHRDRRVSGAQ